MRMDAKGKQDESDVQGDQPPVPGWYHCRVNNVDESCDKHDAVIAWYEVLAGQPDEGNEDMAGRQLREMMFLDEGKPTDVHLRFALATGIMKPGEEKDVRFGDAVDQQVVIRVTKRTDKKDKNKEYACVADRGLAIWNPSHPDVKDVPKHGGNGSSAKTKGGGGNGGSGSSSSVAKKEWNI